MNKKFEYVTDTATICLFDAANLKHRLNDTIDWWSIPEDEVDELNKNNLIIAALPEDGKYEVSLQNDFSANYDYHIFANLNCISGELFIGAGEHISGENMEPKDWRHLSGKLINIEPGCYQVDLYLFDSFKIAVTLKRNTAEILNKYSWPLELCD